jgi:predicted ATP-dependent protease
VEGDSASLAEGCALVSAIAQVPLRQSFAVTGSINQHGMVQVIGAVNEKIEGFFDACRLRGLTGKQGVLIPADNIPHLMLRVDVIDAVERGSFHIYGVHSLEEAIPLLTGLQAGARDANGAYTPGTLHALVEQRLREFARVRQQFAHDASATRRTGG